MMRTSSVSLPHISQMSPNQPAFSGTRGQRTQQPSSGLVIQGDVFTPRCSASPDAQPSTAQALAMKFGQAGSSSTSGQFTAAVESNHKAALKALSKWKTKAKKNGDSVREQIVRNLLRDIPNSTGHVITAKSGKDIHAVALLETPAGKSYAMLEDLTNSGSSSSKGAGSCALETAKTVAKSHGRTHLILYSYSEGTVDYYKNRLGFEFVRTIPDFPNGVYALPLEDQ